MAGEWPDNKHQPTVSHSSISSFKACDRAYALRYHHQIIPDLSARYEHKREKTLQPLNCFPGSVFHDTIQSALTIQRDSGAFPADLMTLAWRVTHEYINHSRDWVRDVTEHPILGRMHPKWPDHQFAQPVESFYYDGDFPPNYRTVTKEKLIKWFERFVALMPELPFSSVSPEKWLFPKQLAPMAPWFIHNDDFAVYANFDFITKDRDEITIYDWKTGKRSSGETSVAEQLVTYAAYAVSKWSVAPDSIRLFAVWVDDGSVQEVDIDQWELDRAQKQWEHYQHDWKSRLSIVNGDAGKLFEEFPMTNDTRTCLRCSFRSCPGRLRAAMGSTNAPTDLEFWDQ